MSLQSGYKQLEYIQSSGTQYIDTGFKPNQNTKFEVDLAITNTSCHVFGARTSYLNKAFVLFWASNSDFCIQMADSDFNGGTFDTTKRYKVTMTSSQLFLDDNLQVSYSVGDFQCEKNAWLMSCYSSSASEYARGKLYSAKIYDGNTLVRNFIPCKNPDGVIGMWDDVNSVFYGNAGTGNFTAGAEVKGSHKTLISGTAYEVKGGKCLVNGTSYDIKKGRTLINGTGEDIVFSSVSPILDENDWTTIREVSDAGQGANYWSIGDRKEVTLNGTVGHLSLSNYTTYAFIIGFNHNASVEGSNRIHFQLAKTALSGGTDVCFCDNQYAPDSGWSTPGAGYFVMNAINTNSGGWKSSQMRTNICGTSLSSYSGTIIAVIPAALRAVLKSVTKYTDNTGGRRPEASSVTATTDYFFLLSEFEVFGSIKYANSNEKNKQSQYAYYSAGNSKIKYKHNGTSTAALWWLRSPVAGDSSYFVYVYTNGAVARYSAIGSLGFAPGFCV